MPTVVNDLIVEPAAAPPATEPKADGAAGGDAGTAPPPPELARQVQDVDRLCRERRLRLWAH